MKRIIYGILSLVVFIFLIVTNVEITSASWYAGNVFKGSGYGGYADITTPVTPIYLIGKSHVYSWISTIATPDWVQAGWGYEGNTDKPYSYYEYCYNGCKDLSATYHILQKIENINWGQTKRYMIKWQAGSTDMWCISIDYSQLACYSYVIVPPVSEIQALSEVQNSYLNELWSNHDNVSIASSANLTFQTLSQANFFAQSPYAYFMYSPSHYVTYRSSPIRKTLLPILSR